MMLLLIPEFFGISLDVYIILLFLGIPTFFFWRWIFKKFIKNGRTRMIYTWLATVIVSPIIYLGVCLVIFLVWTYYPNREFDSKRWSNYPERRYELSKDIITNKALIGKKKADVIRLLGIGENKFEDNDWYYELGYRPDLFNIDPSMLEIDFKDEKVIEVKQHH